MKKLTILFITLIAAAGVAVYSGFFNREPAQAANGQATDGAQAGGAGAAGGARAGGARAGGGGRGGRGGPAGPLTVELATAAHGSVSQQLVVVGNLIGDATVAVVPRAAGRLQDITVRLGDAVRRNQIIAKIEDFELQEQVKQQEAALEVSRATIRQRDADLQLALTNVERSRSLFARQLLPKQTLDDTEARYQAAVAQLDLARAQNNQSTARLDELRINLANTSVLSPVDGFVARRAADPGAFVGPNAPIVDVVDIGRVRLVANIVERDLKQLQAGDAARVGVDAFPGEVFTGRIARIAPVLDPATRTAPIEIEIPNPGFRLKPGMYARVAITTEDKKAALLVPSNALVDVGGRRGVFLAAENNTVTFRPLRIGIEEPQQVEVLDGLSEGDRVVTIGAAALRDGDPILPVGAGGRGRRGGNAGPVADGGASGRPVSAPQAAAPAASVNEQVGTEGRQGRRGGNGQGRGGRGRASGTAATP